MKPSWLITLLVLASFSVIGQPDPFDSWTWRNRLPTGNNLYGITAGNGHFVAVGGAGTIVTSNDGVNWVQRQSGTRYSLYGGVAFASGQFVAVGDTGTIVTSNDGVNWVQRQSGTQNALSAITYGNGQFVAVGGAIVTSADGVNWTQHEPGTTYSGIAYGNGKFVAIESRYNSATEKVESTFMTSVDAANWIQGQTVPKENLESIAFGSGLFAAYGTSSIVWTSADGMTWVQRRPGTSAYLDVIVYLNGHFLDAEESNLGVKGAIVTSTDGINWTIQKRVITGRFWGIAYSGGQYVALGGGGTILTSNDGVNWTRPETDQRNDLGAIAYGNGPFVAVGEDFDSPSGTILTSTDRENWVRPPSSHRNGGFAVTYGNGQFVVLGYGIVHTSADGVNWVERDPGYPSPSRAITYGNGEFVAVGSGLVMTSSDAITWVARRLDPELPTESNDLWGVAFGNGLFVAVGSICGDPNGCSRSVILRSTDGVNWVQTFSGATNQLLRSVAYGNGQFVAVGYADASDPHEPRTLSVGSIMSSGDGVNWVVRQPVENVWVLTGVTHGNGQFVAVGADCSLGRRGIILNSGDGITWDRHDPGTDNWLEGVVYGNGRFVAVGDGGTILESASIIRLTIALNATAGSLSFSLEGPTGLDYTIQTSSDLRSWRDMTKIASAQSNKITLDGVSAKADRQYFRAVSP